MLSQIAYFPIYGKPLILYIGITTLILFIITASIGLMVFRGVRIPFKFHPTMAGISLTVGIIHGILGLSTGRPFIILLGITTISLFLITASIGLMIFRGRNIPFKIHPTMASIAITAGITHGTLGILIYLP
jgi:hypothetical protein